MKAMLILNVLLLAVLAWSYSLVSSTNEILEQALRDKQSCLETAAQINLLRKRSEELNVARRGHDCGPDIVNLLAKHQIKSLPVSGRDSGGKENNLAIKSIDNPIGQPVTLQQLVGFVDSSYSHDICYFVESLTIENSNQENLINKPEKWLVKEMQIKFLVDDSTQ